MDILHLVDRLEEIFNEGRSIWFTHSVAVDEDRMLDLIDQMRTTIPEDREKAEQIVSRDQISQEARVYADQMIAEARLDADRTRADADQYVLQSLTNMEMELERILTQVRNGIHTLQNPPVNPPES